MSKKERIHVMNKPIIGITADIGYMARTDTYTGLPVHFIQTAFAEAVHEAGGIPLIIPTNASDYIDDIMSLVDGVILTGGSDVSPQYYGQEPRAKLGMTKPDRDKTETEVFKAAIRDQKPVLGVCRGLQLLNAALGGTLYQDLSENEAVTIQHDQLSRPSVTTHTVSVDQNSYIHRLIKDGTYVNSYHHQIIDSLAEDLRSTAYSRDGVIEGVESLEELPLIIGTQWHPETLFKEHPEQVAIFEGLVQRADSYRAM